MTLPPVVTVQATEYEVSILLEGDINRSPFVIAVQYRGGGMWAVTRHGACLGSDGEWSREPIPSERDDAWLETRRFDLDTALRLAREAAPHVAVNGRTVLDAYRRAHDIT
ncbi:hypothetical protein ACFVS9_28395 [Streptomyces sp. NPDC058008]|uniref:hypothetical protein n=1 Tax=Streptomyces sp. NPDC058008 TaxID=3346303 RepID=UPI0036E58EF0